MVRLSRISLPGWPHFVTQSSHHGRAVLVDLVDRDLFRQFIQQSAATNNVVIHAYSFSSVDLQLLVTPGAADSLSRMMQSFGRSYGAAFNRRHGNTGGLWSGRFRSTVIDPEQHLLNCMRFIDGSYGADPALISDVAVSSAAHHLGRATDYFVADHSLYWELGNTPFERQAKYRELLSEQLPKDLCDQIRAAAVKGWPLGSEKFIATLATSTSRRLRPLRPGRPRKY